MSLQIVRRAFEKRQATMVGALVTSFENIDFTPTANVPFQKLDIQPNVPDNTTQGGFMYLERGFFNITVCYPMGRTAKLADTQVQLIRSHFKNGTTMVESGVNVNVVGTPRVGAAFVDGDRYCITVVIEFQAQIST